MSNDSKTYKVFIVAGEASGDVLGGKLLNSLKGMYPNIISKGVGGANMKAAGAELVFNCADISLMGFIEILPNLPRILLRLRQTVAAIEAFKPDILITIDSPGFNFHLVSRIRRRFDKQFPIVHYVAPTVWAYKKERAELVARLYDHILLILPFEKPYFDAVNIPATYVGHHIIEDKLPKGVAKLKTNSIPILVMPGSRLQEVRYMGSIFARALVYLEVRYNIKVKALIPTLPTLEEAVKKAFHPIDAVVSSSATDKQKFFKSASLSLVKSGTSSLEVARYGIPCVVGYRMSSFTYRYLKRVVYAKFISLINLLLDKPVIPELIQENCSPEMLALELHGLLNKDKAASMKKEFKKAINLLSNNEGIPPSDLAAKTILKLLTKN